MGVAVLTAISRLVAAVWLVAILVGLAGPVSAQTEGRDIVVATRILPPLVVGEPGKLSGFSIELWDAITQRLKLKTTFHPAPDVRALLEQIRAEKAEIGVAAISITSAREPEFEFSQPILNAGLQIMIRGRGQDGAAIRSPTCSDSCSRRRAWYGSASRFCYYHPGPYRVVSGEGLPGGLIPTEGYIPGILYAMYWSAATLATQAENRRGNGWRALSRCSGCSSALCSSRSIPRNWPRR